MIFHRDEAAVFSMTSNLPETSKETITALQKNDKEYTGKQVFYYIGATFWG